MRAKRWPLAAALVGALALTACGSDDDNEKAAATPSTAAAGATAARCDNVKATLQLGFFPNAQYLGALVAADKGYFADEGLKLELKPGGPTVNAALQLAQGTVQFAIMPFADAYNAAAKGGKVVQIGQSTQQNPVRYISFKSETPMAGPQDLKGKTVGAQQAGNLAPELKGLLKAAGLSDDDVEIKQISFNVDDFVAKRVQVFPARVFAHISMLEAKGFEYPADFSILDPNAHGAGVADEGEYVNADFNRENPEAATCFLRAARHGWEAALKDPAVGVAAVKKHAPQGAFTDRDIEVGVREMLKLATTTSAGDTVAPMHLDLPALEASVKLMREAGVVEGEVSLDEFVDPAPLAAVDAASGDESEDAAN